MPTLEEIKQQIEDWDKGSYFLGRKEVKELPNIIQDNERIEYLIQGLYNDGHGVLVCTNTRLIFIDKGLLYGLKVEDFPIDKIGSVSYEVGLMWGKFIITSSGNDAVIKQVDKHQIKKFAEHVTKRLNDKSSNTISNQSSQDDLVSKLERLAALKEKGILTDEEFAEQKAKILNS